MVTVGTVPSVLDVPAVLARVMRALGGAHRWTFTLGDWAEGSLAWDPEGWWLEEEPGGCRHRHLFAVARVTEAGLHGERLAYTLAAGPVHLVVAPTGLGS